MKSFVRQLEGRFGQKGFLEGCDFDRARSVIRQIEGAETFDDLIWVAGKGKAEFPHTVQASNA